MEGCVVDYDVDSIFMFGYDVFYDGMKGVIGFVGWIEEFDDCDGCFCRFEDG